MDSDWQSYKRLRNMVTIAVRNEKKAYFKHSIKYKNSKGMWSELKSLMGGTEVALCDDIVGSKWNVNEINKHFIDSIPKLLVDSDTEMFYKHNLKSTVKSISTFKPVSETEILQIISSIKSKAIGADGISILTVKLCIPFLLSHITHIRIFFWRTQCFLTAGKKPMFHQYQKKPNIENSDDLRPKYKQYKIIQYSNISGIVGSLCCKEKEKACLYRECGLCKSKKIFFEDHGDTEWDSIIHHFEWKTLTEERIKNGKTNLVSDEVVNDLYTRDFVLARFSSNKNSVTHYIGQVSNKYGDGDYEVKFLRKTAKGKCVFPNAEDVASVNDKDIIQVLTDFETHRGI
ncbi:hypothetical protein WA026_004249 [Henosepilachna vigintioctopunctata]|uniref:Uncharacterized protein n=1 Tax=Henosepilachna vigintioctopunctata TaxID=420089 RepID=A0AAW1VAA5_9CUCU